MHRHARHHHTGSTIQIKAFLSPVKLPDSTMALAGNGIGIHKKA
jgi:hypothetical protein